MSSLPFLICSTVLICLNKASLPSVFVSLNYNFYRQDLGSKLSVMCHARIPTSKKLQELIGVGLFSTVSQVSFPRKETDLCARGLLGRALRKRIFGCMKTGLNRGRSRAVTTETSAGPQRSSGTERALWSCPKRRKGGWAFPPSRGLTDPWMWALLEESITLANMTHFS